MTVIDEIEAERRRHTEVEVWTADHDDTHTGGELAKAAACYAYYAGEIAGAPEYRAGLPPPAWPFDTEWWKPKNPRRDLIRAAALIVAEIERLDRETVRASRAPRHEPRP